MSYPILEPVSKMSKVILPNTGTLANVVATNLPFGIYVNSDYWQDADAITAYKSGSVEQVAYTYKKLGGDVLDLEITENQVHSAYEEACLEYSYMINSHQARNLFPFVLGQTTGTFDQAGQLTADSAVSSGSNPELKFPNMNLSYIRQISAGTSTSAGHGGSQPIFSASFTTQTDEQDYDLQEAAQAVLTGSYASLADRRIVITRVFYKTIGAMWFFYGYFGGLNVVGNLHTYGQYADDSTFEIVPSWQNKMQAMMYEDAIKTRLSDYSFQIYNNKLRIFPQSRDGFPEKMWFEFFVPLDAWEEDPSREGLQNPTSGINNMNQIPLQNLPYNKINSVGKQWIYKYALALAKQSLGYVRNKYTTIPIPNGETTLGDLLAGAAEDKAALLEELRGMLDSMTRTKLLEAKALEAENLEKTLSTVPAFIYIG